MIIHGDLHGANIVINIEQLDVKLIDFGLSIQFNKIDKNKINIYNSLYSITPKAKSIDDLIKWELKCINFIFDISSNALF